ncbi:oligosaccharide flippase family protein [Haliea salexigens]|uniref:oligosaccharide flippase family protein n=1 Tax=Haliea salexigens TaxID=287487 RepID=UPI0004158745|nr:oligosaccharide flippase family protein [Haliea salexigens]
MSFRALLNNAFWSAFSHLLQRGSLMLCSIILARSLTTEGFASYSYFQMTVVMLSTYAAMGFGVAASRFFAEIGADEQSSVLPPVGLLVAISTFMSIAAFFAILMLPRALIDSGLPVPHWLIAIGVAVTVLGIVPGGGILGLEKYRQASLVSLFSAFAMLSFTTLASIQQEPTLGMLGIVLGLLIQIVGQYIVIFQTTGISVFASTCRWSLAEIHKILWFAGPMFLVSVLSGSIAWIVGRLIFAASGEIEFALYSIALQWFALGLFLPGMVSKVLLPRLVRIGESDFRQVVRRGTAMAVVPAVLFAFFGLLFAPWLIRLYGSQYSSFAYVIPAFLAVAALNAPINTIGNAIVAKNGQLHWLWFSCISFISLMACLIIAPATTTFWAIFAHGVAALTMLTVVLIHAKRKRLI